MIRPVLSIKKSFDREIGILLSVAGTNHYGWQVNTLTLYLVFIEVSVGLHFKWKW
jgi:hypothetical protein